ncbi:MAG TPA: acetylornithine transaminase [Mycobacteriales bacterium]|nr:acetylornithine transaminase [Mycobacteriales bacterium]
MTADLRSRARSALMGNYGEAPITLVRGQGCTVWDDCGKSYTDLIAGIAVCTLGHAHPRIAAAVADQLGQIGHVSNLFLTEPAVALAEQLIELVGSPGRVFFANSGAEANEAALKLARRRGRAISPAKVGVVAAEGSFHGRTLGALSVTGQPAKRAPFEPLPAGVTFVPYGDARALTEAVGKTTAAVILEPILGEGGVVTPPAGYLEVARAVATAHDALLILDEVQTGVGRTGRWFAFEHFGVVPDVVTVAKGLGGGLPIGACIGLRGAGDVLQPGDHGSTFGGNPVSAAAALAVLAVIAECDLVAAAADLGTRLADGVMQIGAPLVQEVRGRGLLQAIVFTAPVAKEVESGMRSAGFLVNAVAPDAVRLAPPLIITGAQLDAFLGALPAVLVDIAAAPASAPG